MRALTGNVAWLLSAAALACTILLGGLAACGGDGNAGTGTGNLPPAGGGSVATLEGTCDAAYADATPGAPRVTAILSRTAFLLRVGDVTLRADAQGPLFAGRVTAERGRGPAFVEEQAATISRKTAEVGSLGAIPLPLPGGLRIDSGNPTSFCQSTLVDGSLGASCGDIADFGYLMPRSVGKRHGQRRASLA